MLALVSDVFADAPSTLVALVIGGGSLGLLMCLALVRRAERKLTGRPLRPVSMKRKLATFLVAVVSSGAAIVGVLLLAALSGQRPVPNGDGGGDGEARLAEVQCIETAPGKLRLYYVALDRDGGRGPTRVFDLVGARCALTGEVLHLRAAFRAFGAGFARVVRVAGKPAREEDGNPTPTIFSFGEDRGFWSSAGAHGPLRLMTDATDGNTVLAEPDPRVRYELVWKSPSFVLQKR